MPHLTLSDWPAAARSHIHGVLTDIDDTLTTEGAITPDALQALADLKGAGLQVIAVTGRPVAFHAMRGLAAQRLQPVHFLERFDQPVLAALPMQLLGQRLVVVKLGLQPRLAQHHQIELQC